MNDSRKLAVVTGASSGIGLELAKQFAENGFDLVMCAEDADLRAAAEQVQQLGAQVTAVEVDLRTPQGVTDLYAAVTALGRSVDAAAVNAGVGRGGVFWETPLEDLFEVIDLNVRSTMHLTHLLVADMVARGQGRLLLTSSIASTMPGTYQAVYNATKSFVQSFAEALQEELKDSEVTVTSLMPGPTDTEFFDRAEMEDTPVGQGKKDDPAKVAKQGFDALMSGKDKIVAGSLGTKAQAAATGVMPDRLKAKMHAAMAKPEDADQS
jgi:short-subunit dehydrogenase